MARLRRRKRREAKPFAALFPSLAALRKHCAVSAAEAALLSGPARPIVLLRRAGTLPPRSLPAIPGSEPFCPMPRSII